LEDRVWIDNFYVLSFESAQLVFQAGRWFDRFKIVFSKAMAPARFELQARRQGISILLHRAHSAAGRRIQKVFATKDTEGVSMMIPLFEPFVAICCSAAAVFSAPSPVSVLNFPGSRQSR
jgi:hypothetical protein